MTQREHTLWLRAMRYMADLMRARGLCGNGWPHALCGLPAGHQQRCQWTESDVA